jgi:glycosyltransferase involved in cell wall biosynthesis
MLFYLLMKLILSHPTANANVRAVASGLYKAGILSGFYTSIASFPGDALDLLSRFSALSEFRRRRFDPSLKPFTHTHPWLEMGRMISLKAGLNKLIEDEKGIFCIDAVYNNLDKYVSSSLLLKKNNQNISAVYAYEDCALATFTQAKLRGIKCIYDLPIAFWETGRRLLTEEADRLPNWKLTLGGGIQDSTQKLDRKSREMELADMVIAPSEFVLNSLPAASTNKFVHMAPFGSPVAHEINEPRPKPVNLNRALRVLFVGSMGQRKGLGDLFQAIRLINNSNIELVVMGSLLAPLEFYRNEFPNFTYETGRPHEQVLALMRTCDVFCLPSIVEGRALVVQEAMSQGLPIIVTPNTGGEDLVQEGKTGFLVPIRSPEVIANRLAWFLDNRNKIPEMGKMAKNHASSYTWDNYSNSIAAAIKTFL